MSLRVSRTGGRGAPNGAWKTGWRSVGRTRWDRILAHDAIETLSSQGSSMGSCGPRHRSATPISARRGTTAAAAPVWIPSIAASMPIAANTSRTSLGFPRTWGPPRFLGRPLLACRGRTHDTRCADFVWAKLPHPRHLRVGVVYWHSFSLDGPENRSEPCRNSVPIVLSHTP